LLRRLEQTHACLAAVKHMLPSVQEEGDVLTAYQLTHQAMQQFIINMHNEWFHTFDSSISAAGQSADAGQGRQRVSPAVIQ